jgi:hypothetical protein
MEREPDSREFEQNPEDEREVPLADEGDGLETPPPTMDPDERLEAGDRDDGLFLDEERPA